MINSEDTEATTEDTDEDKFQCPCRECSLNSYIQFGCPKSRYPYLDMSKLSEDDKDNLAQILISYVKEIVKSFSKLSFTTSKSLKRRNVTIDELRNVVVNFSGDKSLSEALRRESTIDGMFSILGEHWSFFNYEILEHIIDTLGDDDDREKMDAYVAKFKTFCQHKVFEVSRDSYGSEMCSVKKGRKSFVVVIEKSMLQNLGDVKRAQHKIASILEIPSAQLRLHQIDEGSVILVMSVPDDVAQELFPLSKNKIRELKIEGFTIFVPKRLEIEVYNYFWLCSRSILTFMHIRYVAVIS